MVIHRAAIVTIALALFVLTGASVTGQPREILILRHAEKPDSETDPNLTAKGYARAAAIVQFFASSFETPDYIFAAKVSKNSDRSVETLTPLATALHMPLNSKVADEDYLALAQDLLTNPKYDGKLIIICWHHGNIPALAKALGSTDHPKSWPDRVFNRVWRIQYGENGPTLANLPQQLLFGDSTE